MENGKMILEDFLILPKRCQEIFFDYMGGTLELPNGTNPYMIFGTIGFDYSYCQSPIEKIFAFAYDIVTFDNEFSLFNLLAQEEILANEKKYYADFLFDTKGYFSKFHRAENDLKLIVECDGHEYHKATKQQVKHDNERDFNLKMAGYEVLHFSGSQIYEDPFKCAMDTVKYIQTKIGKIETIYKTRKKV